MSFEGLQGRFLGLVPARGGSKRLPGKNTLQLGGKPLIAWSIQAGLSSAYIDEVAVSTDSPEIAAKAVDWGVAAPLMRPAELATDEASSFEVAVHALAHYRENLGKTFEYLVLLQPTSPLRSASDIDGAIELLAEKGADAVISVCETDHHPLWSNTLPRDMSMRGFIRKEIKNLRSQDLPKHYRVNGAVYVCRVESLLSAGGFFPDENAFAFEMPPERSVDIDNEIDFRIAEALLGARLPA